MRGSSDISGLERGFTLIELLVVLLIAIVLMAGFTSFYLSQQRALRRHDIQMDTSQGLRVALEQMARDIRSARKDLTRDPVKPTTTPGAAAAFLTATATSIEFQLDSDSDGGVTSTSTDEHKGFALSGTNLTQLDASTGTYNVLAENVTGLTFSYFDCNGNSIAAPVTTAANLDSIASVGISVTVATPTSVGGIPFSRTEVEKVRLRNKVCS
jgi:type IV pilus assembly protein PilW